MRSNLALVVLWTVALVLAPATHARADGGSDAATDALVRTGVDRYARHDYEGARDAFERAFAMDPTMPGTLFNLALSELQSGRSLSAAKHLRAYLKASGADPARIESARTKWLPLAESRISRLHIDAPAGVAISVDGVPAGSAPFAEPVDVAPGEHEVRATKDGVERSVRVTTAEGTVVEVQPSFDASPTAEVATTPPLSPPVAVDGGPRATGTSPASARMATVIALASASLGTAAVGIGFGIASRNEANRATDLRAGQSASACWPGRGTLPSFCGQLDSAESRVTTDYRAQVGLYVGAGVLAVGAAGSWLLWPHSKRAMALQFQPSFDAHSLGAALGGAF